jgi:hypothetical protein
MYQLPLKDAQLIVQAAATLAANTTSAAFDLTFGALLVSGSYAPGAGGAAFELVIPITSYNFGTGDETYSFQVQSSPDGATWTNQSRAATVAGDSIPSTGGIIQILFASTVKFVRLVLTVAGTAPSIVLQDCYLSPSTNRFGG